MTEKQRDELVEWCLSHGIPALKYYVEEKDFSVLPHTTEEGETRYDILENENEYIGHTAREALEKLPDQK